MQEDFFAEPLPKKIDKENMDRNNWNLSRTKPEIVYQQKRNNVKDRTPLKLLVERDVDHQYKEFRKEMEVEEAKEEFGQNNENKIFQFGRNGHGNQQNPSFRGFQVSDLPYQRENSGPVKDDGDWELLDDKENLLTKRNPYSFY